VNEGVAPKEGDAQLNRSRESRGRIAGVEIQVAEILTRTLINDAEQNSERDVKNQATADESSRAELLLGIFICGCAAPLCGKAPPFRRIDISISPGEAAPRHNSRRSLEKKRTPRCGKA